MRVVKEHLQVLRLVQARQLRQWQHSTDYCGATAVKSVQRKSHQPGPLLAPQLSEHHFAPRHSRPMSSRPPLPWSEAPTTHQRIPRES